MLNQSFPFRVNKLFLLIILYVISVEAIAEYSITNLGTLGGSGSFASSINNQRQIVGFSSISSGLDRAFIYSGDSMQDIGTLSGGTQSSAGGINNIGNVTGFSDVILEFPTRGASHAYMYDGNVMLDLGTLGGSNSFGAAINDNNQVTGGSDIFNQGSHAFLYDKGAMTDLGTLGGTNSWGNDIDLYGAVVGTSQLAGDNIERAFFYDTDLGYMNMLDVGLGGLNSEANGVNDMEQVTGASQTSSGEYHAYRYEFGSLIDLGTLGGSYSRGMDINNYGHVVGDSKLADGSNGSFLYDGNNILDLCVLTNCNVNGWGELLLATSINDNGDITGFGRTSDGTINAFLISSIPIPPSILLFGSGMLCLVLFGRRSKKNIYSL